MPYYRHLPSGLWQATVRLPDGRRRSRTDPLKRVVRVWAEEAEAAIRRGEWADPQDGRITVGQWWVKWSQSRVVERATDAKNASHWRAHVEPRWGSVRLAAVAAWDVEVWLADMSRAGVGATTRAQSFRLFGHMMGDAARHRLVSADPTVGVKAPSIPRHVDRFLTEDEFEQLYAALKSNRDRALVALMALGGLRWGEAAGLHSTRIRLDADPPTLTVVEVRRRDGSLKSRPKSDAGMRVVPVVPRLADALRPVMRRGPLFDVDYTNWRRRVFVPAVRTAELVEPLPTPHDLRHSFGSWLAARGVPAVEIMVTMGHSSLRATERYLHATSGRLGRVSSALSSITA